jgi:hypothetical protein
MRACRSRQIRIGAYLPLDVRQLPNLANLDPAIMARAALDLIENRLHMLVFTPRAFDPVRPVASASHRA